MFDHDDLVELRDLSERHSDLAAAYAEADPDEDLDRIYGRLQDLQAAITCAVADLFYDTDWKKDQ